MLRRETLGVEMVSWTCSYSALEGREIHFQYSFRTVGVRDQVMVWVGARQHANRQFTRSSEAVSELRSVVAIFISPTQIPLYEFTREWKDVN